VTQYRCVYEFTDRGLRAFRQVFEAGLAEDAFDPCDPAFATPLPGSRSIDDAPAETARELAARVLAALPADWRPLLARPGIWAWLTFMLRDTLLPRTRDGTRKLGEVHRWLPSDPGDYRKAQRHLLRMPVTLLGDLGDTADHLLCGDPAVPGELREQLTSQQHMFSREWQAAMRALYYDDATGRLKRGAGGSGAGSPRRAAQVRRQLDVTWDLFRLDTAAILALLPPEFDRFK
jgi:hypothetical protein